MLWNSVHGWIYYRPSLDWHLGPQKDDPSNDDPRKNSSVITMFLTTEGFSNYKILLYG